MIARQILSGWKATVGALNVISYYSHFYTVDRCLFREPALPGSFLAKGKLSAELRVGNLRERPPGCRLLQISRRVLDGPVKELLDEIGHNAFAIG
jgi:hypothetical protein